MAAEMMAHKLGKAVSSAAIQASVIHLYGLTQAPGPSPKLFRDLKGVDGASAVEPIACAGLICWISRVPEEDFAESLSQNMQDLEWLAAATTRHQQVVSAIARSADVLPARFGIEFLNERSLASDVESRRAALKADFNRIRGKEEWGVKVFSLPLAPALPKKKVRTGKEYLEAKSALSRRSARGDQKGIAEFAKALESIADDVAEGGKFAGARRDLEFHKTLLLKRTGRKALDALVSKYSRRWKDKRRVECTGPWPPFSFVSHTESPNP